jgi:hypothetical protein
MFSSFSHLFFTNKTTMEIHTTTPKKRALELQRNATNRYCFTTDSSACLFFLQRGLTQHLFWAVVIFLILFSGNLQE